jgi:hypothetical protein
VQYKAPAPRPSSADTAPSSGTPQPSRQPSTGAAPGLAAPASEGGEQRRRRRRRRRRRPGQTMADGSQPNWQGRNGPADDDGNRHEAGPANDSDGADSSAGFDDGADGPDDSDQ